MITIRNGHPVLPPEQRPKILICGDDMRFFSGICTVTRELVLGTCHRYNWVQMGGLINHPDKSKIDVSEDIRKESGILDASCIIYPVSDYGTQDILRFIVKEEKPNLVLLFTDPRQWIWAFDMHRELHSMGVPLGFLNIWDSVPIPSYNRSYYKCCDYLPCISKQTHNIVRSLLADECEVVDLYEKRKVVLSAEDFNKKIKLRY